MENSSFDMTPPQAPLLSVVDLSKSFRSHWTFSERPAVRSVSFDLQAGDIFGFIGENGAGKTTTIKSILGLIHPDRGEIRFEGRRRPFLTDVGYLPELPYFYDHLSVEETLLYLGGLALRGRPFSEVRKRSEATLRRVGLEDRRKSSVRALSKGLQQRLGLAQAIINEPKLLFLDEPFSGLDPVGRAEFRTIIEELHRSGTSVLISSHILSDVQALCNRVAILVRGEVKKTFSLQDRSELFGEKFQLQLEAEKNVTLPPGLAGLAATVSERETHFGIQFLLSFADQSAARKALGIALAETAFAIKEFRAESKSLEEIFLSITGEKK